MRAALGIFGIAAGAIVVALVGRYGVATSDTRLDGAIAAFFFGVIAVGSIGGPAVAVHLWRTAKGWGKLWGVAAGIIAVVALGANLSNSLGAIAGRADKTLAERQSAKDDARAAKDEIARLTRNLEALGAFTPATDDDVIAARDAVASAERARNAECGDGDPKQRGKYCRAREETEQARRDALTAVFDRKNLTDQTAKLNADLAAERRKLSNTPPVASANPMAETLARVFHMAADDAATWQQVATVVVVELLIAFSLIAWELLTPNRLEKLTATTQAQDERADESSRALPAASSNIVSLDSARVPGDVGKFATARLTPTPGKSVAVAELHEPYRAWCLQEGYRALSREEFATQFAALCEFAGVKKRMVRGHVLAIDLALSA